SFIAFHIPCMVVRESSLLTPRSLRSSSSTASEKEMPSARQRSSISCSDLYAILFFSFCRIDISYFFDPFLLLQPSQHLFGNLFVRLDDHNGNAASPVTIQGHI